MDLYEALMTTRSMRRLTDDPPVTDAEIEHCLRAAAQAPSGGNVQPYHFVVITDPDARAAMAELYLRGWRRYRPAMEAAVPGFPTPEAERSFRRSVELSEHLAVHLADTPSVLFCLASYGTLADEQGPLGCRSRYERRARSASAIWMALSAAPLRRLSFDTNRTSPRPSGTVGSGRIRPT